MESRAKQSDFKRRKDDGLEPSMSFGMTIAGEPYMIDDEKAELLGYAINDINSIIEKLHSASMIDTKDLTFVCTEIETILRSNTKNPISRAEAEEIERLKTQFPF